MKKSMQKFYALLLATLLVFSSLPLLSTAVSAEEGAGSIPCDDPAPFDTQELDPDDLTTARAALTAAIGRLVDPCNLRYYTNEAILRVADALGSTQTQADAFLADALQNGYVYAGANTAESMRESVQKLNRLTAEGDDADENALGYVRYDEPYGFAIHRAESKAHVDVRVVPVAYNGAAIESSAGVTAKSGDRITFALELNTDYPVSAADFPIVYDCAKFSLVDNSGTAYAFGADGTNNVYNIYDAIPSQLISTACLRAKVSASYILEAYTADSPAGLYPDAYRTPDYMRQYKILTVQLMPIISRRTIPLAFSAPYERLFTFTLEVRDGADTSGALQTAVGIPADWFTTLAARSNPFCVTRAAGMQPNGRTPATNGSSALYPFEIFDEYAQFGQSVESVCTDVFFSASGCVHDYALIERVEPTQTEAGYELYRCGRCGHEKTVTLDPIRAYLELSARRAKPGTLVDMVISLHNNPGLTAMLIRLEYDAAALELLRVEDGGLLGEGTIVIGGSRDTIPYTILWEDATAEEDHTQDGTLVTLVFRVRDDAPADSYPVKLSYDPGSTFDKDEQEKPLLIRSADVQVVGCVNGDANLDGELTVADVISIHHYLVDTLVDANFDEVNADYNRDGQINLKDTTRIKRHLAGGWDA